MAETHIHHGSHQSIPDTASPGLVFLREMMNAVDSPHQDPSPVAKLITDDARFIFNGIPATSLDDVFEKLRMRGTQLRKYVHEGEIAWDIAKADGTRTVMYEATTIVEFKEDPEGVEAKVRDFGVMEIVLQEGSWRAKESRTFADYSPTTPEKRKDKGSA